jgi:prepilin-type N-terminal cleavage/methylation domain-containing protein
MNTVSLCPRRHATAGFTLVELLVTLALLGILSGIAVPKIRGAVFRADAAHIVSDAQTVRLAALEHLAETGAFPPSSDWGAVPSQLQSRLPDGFEFQYEGIVEYRWRRAEDGGAFNAEHLGRMEVRYTGLQGLAQAMRAYAGTFTTWSESSTIFLFPS